MPEKFMSFGFHFADLGSGGRLALNTHLGLFQQPGQRPADTFFQFWILI
jgi:hypothetical protein